MKRGGRTFETQKLFKLWRNEGQKGNEITEAVESGKDGQNGNVEGEMLQFLLCVCVCVCVLHQSPYCVTVGEAAVSPSAQPQPELLELVCAAAAASTASTISALRCADTVHICPTHPRKVLKVGLQLSTCIRGQSQTCSP